MIPIAEQRLAGQRLSQSTFAHPAEVVAWLTAVQAQDYSGARWSIGLRRRGTGEAAVEQAIRAGVIVRTWALRGTLHLVAAADLRWLLALIAPQIIAANGRRYRQLQLDEGTLARGNELLRAALDGGIQRDRAALGAALEEGGINTEGQRLPYLLQHAALAGLIGQGEAPRNNPMYYLLDDARAESAPPDREAALAELARRYFTAHGPATVRDFIWWSGLPAAAARQGLEAAGSQLARAVVGEQVYWQGSAPDPPPQGAASAHFLPAFDPFLVSYRDRSATIAPQHMEAWSQSKAMFSPSIIVQGRLVGLWKRALKKDAVQITAVLLRALTAGEQALVEAAAADFGAFLGLPVSLHWREDGR